MLNKILYTFFLIAWVASGCCGDDIVFGNNNDGAAAAFGDFNSDELTDVFMLKDDFHTIQILLGAETEPLLRPGPKCEFKNFQITSILPGDFDGDASMDVLFTVKLSGEDLGVYVNYGSSDSLNCTNEHDTPLITIKGEPLAVDYNMDMIIDLFALNPEDKNSRTFWIFNKDRSAPMTIRMDSDDGYVIPHSNAYLDINHDFMADLFIKGHDYYEVWNGSEFGGFKFSHKITYPEHTSHIGQSLFLDFELKGVLNHIVPVCFDEKCHESGIMIYTDKFHNIQVNFKDPDNEQWGFVKPHNNDIFGHTITLRGGDYNMDGYPDLLATLKKSDGQFQTFLLENVPCDKTCSTSLSRTFAIQWKALLPFSKNTVLGTFYDFFQDGILDILMVEKYDSDKYRTVAFRNSLDYDANFVKVIVLTGLPSNKNPPQTTPLGRKKKTFGSNLPGPRIAYNTTTQDGYPQSGTSAQIPQSAYFALQLPYTVFGLGRTPNFVDQIKVGVGNRTRVWTQLIPNSQMIVVPYPLKDSSRWKAQLFVTPSKLILMSTIALGGTCFVIMLIILGLYIKEKREDKLEKLQEAHRFHFDAM